MQPIEPRFFEGMNEFARDFDRKLNAGGPRKIGFCLLIFDLDRHDGRMNYISTAQREDMLIAMKEFIANCEGRVTDEVGHA